MEAARRRRIRGSTLCALLVAACAAITAGCGGGSGGAAPVMSASVPAPAAPASTLTSARVTLAVPATSLQSARRAASAVATLRGLGFVVTPAVGPALAAQFVDVSASSPNCTATTNGGRSCSFALTVPVGTSTVQVTGYNTPPASGTAAGAVLSVGTTTVTAQAGVATQLALTLNNVIASIKLALVNNVQEGQSVQAGATGAPVLQVSAFDVDGNLIVGSDPFANPISIAFADTSGAVSLSASTVKTPADVVTIGYNGGLPPVGGYALNVSANGVAATAVSGALVYRPAIPRPRAGTTTVYVLNGTTAITVPSPYPSVAFGSPDPAPLPSATTAVYQSTEVRSTAAPTTTVLGTPLPTRSYERSVSPVGSAFQTGFVQEFYGNSVVNGNRIDGLTMASITTSTFTYASGASNGVTTVVYPAGQVVYRVPLTNGDTWTTSPLHTVNFNNSDTRPINTVAALNQTQQFGADGSWTLTDTRTFAPNSGGTPGGQGAYTGTQNPDGSGVETSFDTISGITEQATYGTPAGGTMAFTFAYSGPGIKPATFQGTAPAIPGSPAAYSDTGTATGPVLLDSRCGLTAPTTAFLNTERVMVTLTGQFRQTNVLQRFDQVGVGTVCQISTNTVDTYGQSVTLQLPNATGTGTTSYTTFIPTALSRSSTTTTVRTMQYFLTQAVQRSTQSLGGGGSIGVGIEPAMVAVHHGGR